MVFNKQWRMQLKILQLSINWRKLIDEKMNKVISNHNYSLQMRSVLITSTKEEECSELRFLKSDT